MSAYRLIGLESILVGDARTEDPGMPNTLTTVGNIVPGSAKLAIEVPGKTELDVEDSDFADIIVNTRGAKMFEFATRDMALKFFRLGMGGSVNTGNTLWRASNTAFVVNEKAIKATSKSFGGKKLEIECVRTALRQGADLLFSKEESGTLSYQADVLRPYQLTTDYPIIVRII